MNALLLCLSVFLVLVGCSNIRSKQPVGKEAVDLSEFIGEVSLSTIAGEWVDADGSVSSITVTNAKEGEVLYASLDIDDDDRHKLKLRMSGDHVFANFEPDEKGERIWVLIKVQAEMNEILVWEPDTKEFRGLIAEGKIKGTNDQETSLDENGEEVTRKNPGAVIDDASGAWVEKMVDGEFGVIFNWKSPTVLRRRVSEGETAALKNESADDSEKAAGSGDETATDGEAARAQSAQSE